MALRGKIEGINNYIDFEAEDIISIEWEFHSAVEDYLEFCAEIDRSLNSEVEIAIVFFEFIVLNLR